MGGIFHHFTVARIFKRCEMVLKNSHFRNNIDVYNSNRPPTGLKDMSVFQNVYILLKNIEILLFRVILENSMESFSTVLYSTEPLINRLSTQSDICI